MWLVSFLPPQAHLSLPSHGANLSFTTPPRRLSGAPPRAPSPGGGEGGEAVARSGAGEGIPLPPRHPKAREPALASSNANDHLWQRAPVEQTKGAWPGGVGISQAASAPPNRASGPLPPPPPPSFLARGVRLARPTGASCWAAASVVFPGLCPASHGSRGAQGVSGPS